MCSRWRSASGLSRAVGDADRRGGRGGGGRAGRCDRGRARRGEPAWPDAAARRLLRRDRSRGAEQRAGRDPTPRAGTRRRSLPSPASKPPKVAEKKTPTERPTANQTEQLYSKQPLRGRSADTNVEVGRTFGSPAPQLSGGIGIGAGGGGGAGAGGIPGGSEYGRRIQLILSRNYNPPTVAEAGGTHYVIIQLRVARDGRILSLAAGASARATSAPAPRPGQRRRRARGSSPRPAAALPRRLPRQRRERAPESGSGTQNEHHDPDSFDNAPRIAAAAPHSPTASPAAPCRPAVRQSGDDLKRQIGDHRHAGRRAGRRRGRLRRAPGWTPPSRPSTTLWKTSIGGHGLARQ